MRARIVELECKRCGHVWVPRKREVRQCPACKTAYWDQAREIKDGRDEA